MARSRTEIDDEIYAALYTQPEPPAETAKPDRNGFTFICDVPKGARMMAHKGKVIIFAPDKQPQELTLQGLKSLEWHERMKARMNNA